MVYIVGCMESVKTDIPISERYDVEDVVILILLLMMIGVQVYANFAVSQRHHIHNRIIVFLDTVLVRFSRATGRQTEK